MKIKLVALCGKAGAGKDTILRQVVNSASDEFNKVINCTTRPPREKEQEGINYYFLTIEQFTDKLLNGDMLEVSEFNGWHYGTTLSSLSKDKTNIGVFNPTGLACLSENSNLDLQIYWIDAPDHIRLIRQLTREYNPDVREIIRRYFTDDEDFCDMEDFDYTRLLNEREEDIKTCANRIARWAK